MGHAVVKLGVRSRSGPRESIRRRVLTAAGALPPRPMLTTYDMTHGSPCERHFHEAALAAGLPEFGGDRWPTETAALDDSATVVFRDGNEAVYRLSDGTLIFAALRWGWATVSVAAASRAAIAVACAAFRASCPPSFLIDGGDDRVPITFWSDSPFGPVPRLRRIDASPWEPIAGNYTAIVRDELAGLMQWSRPEADGQLLLWQGPPGTGKTWALRALASEWAPWAEFHYITDPDAFFVDNPSYMIDVLLSDSYSAVDEPTGDVYQETDAEGKWRVLILEDTGELLSAGAKDKYGQGLSRLLNVVDGMIGQGLRVLALVTTNDELGDLHPAVQRPGRCASQISFGPLTEDEARAWTGDPSAPAGTLAELYAREGAGEEPIPERDPSFTPEPEDTRDLMASGAPGVRSEIRRVAVEHEPSGGTYGDAWFRPTDATVFWNAADWSTDDECAAAAAAFLAIDGVDAFESDAEVGHPDGTDDWEKVWPSADDVAALERDALALARAALPPDPAEGAVADEMLDELRATLAAAGDPLAPESVPEIAAALSALAESHRLTVEGIAAVVASAGAVRDSGRSDTLTLATLGVLREFAARPAPAAPQAGDVHVYVPKTDLNVTVEGPTVAPRIDVHVPEQPAPAVHFHEGDIDVHVPKPDAPAPAPVQVDVHVPPVAPLEPQFTVHMPAPAAPGSRAIRVEFDAEGRKVFVPVDVDPEADAA